MDKNFEYKGQWFLPSAPEKRVQGILSYDINEGGTLELFGNFDSSILYLSRSNDNIILGLTNDSKEITLYSCFIQKSGGAKLVVGGESAIPHTFYHINYILEGVHIETESQLLFEEIRSEHYGLDEWVGISGFDRSTQTIEAAQQGKFVINYECPEPIDFLIKPNVRGQFNFVAITPGISTYDSELCIKQRLELRLFSEQEHDLESLVEMVFRFQHFLVLGLFEKSYPIRMELFGKRFLVNNGDDKPPRKRIKLYFAVYRPKRMPKNLSVFDMLFSYREIKIDFPVIIKKWFEQYEILEPAYNLFFARWYNDDRFTTNTFLNYSQSIETFHTKTNNHTKMPTKDYDQMKLDILGIVPAKHHGWLNEQFMFGNSLNLHRRLTDVVNDYSNIVLDEIIPDKDKFIMEVKQSRNYYTHYSKPGSHVIKGTQLFFLSEKLKILLVCAFLMDIGLKKTLLENGLKRNKHRFFNHLIRW